MAKEYQFNWRPPIPPLLQQGTLFDKYDDDSTCLELNALVKIDEYGFFFHWQVEGRDSVVIDLAQIWEVRRAGIPKDGRVLFELEQRGPPRETLEDRTLWITHGQDLVTVQSIYLVAQDVETAKVWRTGINEVLRVSKIKHVCAMTSLQKHWTFLRLSLNERKKIPLKNMIRLFASGKPEKMVHKCLCDLGLGGDKYIMPRVMKKGIGKKVQNLYKCRSGRARKEREELDVDLFTFDKFLRLYHKICPRTDVQELFVKLSGQKEYLTKDRLINFLNEEQRDPRLNEILFPFFDNERVQQLIAKYEQDETYIANGKMSGDGFLRFLLSDENAPVFLDRIELCQEMDQPLCHYYINSSHNTYLTGRQYGGKSSAEIYRQVLLSGCRCIELDCWDGTGENKGEPIITHGKAMCTDVFFRDVLYQIRDTAFARSDFPVILSFENHCSKSNQLKMAKYCMEIFGDMLLSKPFDDVPLEPGAVLPSPNRLKRKILIKNKRLKPEIEKHQLDQFLREGKLDEDEEITETPEVVGEDSISPPGDQRAHPERDPSLAATVPQLPSATSSSLCLSTPSRAASSGDLVSKEADEAHPELKQSTFISKLKPLGFAKKQELDVFDRGLSDKRSFRYNGPRREDHSDSAALLDPITRTISARGRRKPILTKEEEERIFAEYHYTGATTNIHPLLSSLVNYTHPVKFSGFDVAEMNNLHFHMSSFSESTGLGYLKQFAPEFVNYNKRQLSRIYPKGARVDSSNFLPQIFWNAGCQMVSLNFQTPDVYMQLNQGKFEYNGNSGYLLKPDFMRRPDRTFDPFSESPVDGVIAAHCSVRVISGQFVCERKVGTYVEVEMYGLPTDTIRKEHRTKIIPGNGLNPVYNEEPFVFRKVVLPELAVLRFAVYEDNGRQLGQRILPLDGLQSGYRHISLRTETNLPMCLPFLFVHIVLKTYVPDELSGLVDALADPRAYLTQQQKRQEALHHMGVEDSDIVDVLPTKNNLSAKNKTLQKANGSSSTLLNDHSQPQSTRATDGQTPTNSARPPGEAAVDKFKVDPIEVEDLRKDKSFVKLKKKHIKDMDEMKKKQQKQRESCQKQQMRSLVSNQTDEWSSLMRRHETEEFEMRKNHIREEFDLLRKLMLDAQKTQMTALKTRLEAENKELRSYQTKKSMEDSSLIKNDKGIKTKAEKDRRVKELQEKNLKLFVEERRRLAMKAQKHEEQLAKRHQNQVEELDKEAQKAFDQEEANHKEEQLASRPESVV